MRGNKFFDRDIDHEGKYQGIMETDEIDQTGSYFYLLNGGMYESNRVYFDYNKPEVFSFSPEKIYGGETVIIEGKNFGTKNRTTKLFANNKEISDEYKIKQTNTRIECIIPGRIDERFLQLKLVVHGHEFLLGEPYEIPYVKIDSLSLSTLTEQGYSVSIYGKGLVNNSENKIRLFVNDEEVPENFYAVDYSVERIRFDYKDYLIGDKNRYLNIPERDLKIKVKRNETYSNEFTIPFRHKGYFTKMKDFPGEARWGA